MKTRKTESSWQYTVSPEGICPIQAFGVLRTGGRFYFRMRGGVAAICVSKGGDPAEAADWTASCPVADQFTLSEKEIRLLIDGWVTQYLEAVSV